MHPVAVALVWHHHQPYYPDDFGYDQPMPWVRLHGTKDYLGMALVLREVPEMRCTVNLAPSLIEQLEAYTDHNYEDEHLRISRLPADGLSESGLSYLLDNFFMVHPDQMIRPYRRYQELLQKRALSSETSLRAARRFSRQDIIDLQCWSNLTWIHPLVFAADRELSEFRAKGRDWTEAEKIWLLDKQQLLLRQILPLYAELEQRGQVELSTSPYFHPILPLLWDKRLARQALPEVPLPTHLEPYPEDGQAQIAHAVALHQRVFGRAPRGLWPSEGAVCQPMLPAIAQAGLRWIASDEEVLGASTEGWVGRDAQGHVHNPERLYRPWLVEEQGEQLAILFRDHALSDQIGFHYQRYAAGEAVDDFIAKLEAIGRGVSASPAAPPALVSVILDGENCWEYYPQSGLDFLRQLYGRLTRHQHIEPVCVSDYLAAHPPTERLTALRTGSWIKHDLGIWIGHGECNQAWDLLWQTRDHLVRAGQQGDKSELALEQAWRELYIAEGSDWFWWFGDSHSSAQDAVFDRLFRKHLQNVYVALGEQPPPELARPIAGGRGGPRAHSDPTSLLSVRVDGRRTYFEWLNAGHHHAGAARGAMSMAQPGRISDLYFGFDRHRLLIRCDTHRGAVRERLADIDLLRLVLIEPSEFELLLSHPSWREPLAQLYHEDVPVSEAGIEVASDTILELGIPVRSLGLGAGASLRFAIELIQGEHVVERVPGEALIELSVPSPDFELMMWQA